LITASLGSAATPEPTHQPRTTASAALHPLNPIRLADTADPGVVRADGRWYIYYTSSGGRYQGRYPIITSDNLTSWTAIGYIFPPGQKPAWASKSQHWWAPEVHRVGQKYIAYFTTREDSTNRFVIGAALADKPTGPFRDVGKPIIRTEGVGIIDVTLFSDPVSGKNFLIWKEDRNDFVPQEPTPIMMQEMTADGLHPVGKSREIMRNDLRWEGVLVEGPSLVYNDGWYYIFYSGNEFATDLYAVGVARSRNVWGPYEKHGSPILTQDKNFSGPGHQFVIKDEHGHWHIFYHGRLKALQNSYRYLLHDIIVFGEDGWPTINDGHPGPVNPDAVEIIRHARAKGRPAVQNGVPILQ